MTIRARLLLLYLLVIGLSCAGLVWWITSAVRVRYLEAMEESLVDTSVVLASLLEKEVVADRVDAATFRGAFASAYGRRFEARIYSIVKREVDVRVYVADRAGIVIYDSEGGRDEGRDYSQWNDVKRTLAGRYGARATMLDGRNVATAVIHVAAPIRAADGSIVGVIAVAKPQTYVNQLFAATRQRVMLYSIPVAIALGLIGWLASVWLTRPLERLTAHARALRDGNPSTLPRLTAPEIATLAQALEEMRDALEGKNYVEQYVQALTHQIKAPLSAVRGAAELMQESMPLEDRQRFLGNIRAEADRIQRIVDRLLQLAALEKRKGLESTERIDLAELAHTIVDELRPMLTARKLTVRIEAASRAGTGVAVNGERFLLHEAALNLLHNAAEFSPAGGEIVIAVSGDQGRARLEILDRGPGVPGYALSRVFERFYSLPRPDSGAKSTGLGLSLVREIAHLHGGEATLENRGDGMGARAVLEFVASM